jgi:hypothetical protein
LPSQVRVYPLILGCQYVLVFSSLYTDFTGSEADHDDMASPHRSESFFHDSPASPSISLVPIGDGDSFDVVLGPVLILVRSEEASLEQESPLAVEPVGDEPLLIEGGPSHVSSSPDRQLLVTTDGAVSSEFTDSQVEDLTEQAAVDYDYELDESWLAECLPLKNLKDKVVKKNQLSIINHKKRKGNGRKERGHQLGLHKKARAQIGLELIWLELK